MKILKIGLALSLILLTSACASPLKKYDPWVGDSNGNITNSQGTFMPANSDSFKDFTCFDKENIERLIYDLKKN
jgi:hypothetical protein